MRKPDSGLFALLAGDGRPLLAAFGLGLVVAGGFAVFLAARGELLPHDVAFLGMTRSDLCGLNGCRIVHFMEHDRVSFGGVLIAIGILYLWLVAGPLSEGRRWAWQLLAVSGVVGFLSFLAHLGYGYLDTWHGAATLALAMLFICGLARTKTRIEWTDEAGLRSWPTDLRRRGPMLAAAFGMVSAGATILAVGMTTVFVPEDLEFLDLASKRLDEINPRLIPLIAHDRAGFGGAVVCCGAIVGGIAWRAPIDRAARQALGVAGIAGFGAAIGVHPAVGYTDAFHLAPAVAGAVAFAIGWWMLPTLTCRGGT